jgi:hypothetical protein
LPHSSSRQIRHPGPWTARTLGARARQTHRSTRAPGCVLRVCCVNVCVRVCVCARGEEEGACVQAGAPERTCAGGAALLKSGLVPFFNRPYSVNCDTSRISPLRSTTSASQLALAWSSFAKNRVLSIFLQLGEGEARKHESAKPAGRSVRVPLTRILRPWACQCLSLPRDTAARARWTTRSCRPPAWSSAWSGCACVAVSLVQACCSMYRWLEGAWQHGWVWGEGATGGRMQRFA